MDRRRAARLLVLCARPQVRSRDLPEVQRLLREGPDWKLLIPRADEEGVLPLLYWNLRERPAEIPPEVLERLKVHYLRSVARNAQIGRQIEPFLRAVRDAGLRVVLTKGLRLASTVYPDIALRPFWDVDIIAVPSEWPALKKILDGQGFEETPAPGPGTDLAASDPGWIYSPYFRRGALVLEFHFNVLGLHFPVRPAPRAVATPMSMVIGGTDVAVFSPEYELCYLCLHAQQHSYEKLVWLTDIAELASRKDVAWGGVYEVCEAFGVRAPVYYGLALVNRLWPETIPGEVLSKIRPRGLPRAALGFFWPGAGVARRDTPVFWPYYMPSLFSLWERRSPRLTARALGLILFPPRPWLALACGVPKNSLFLYYQYARRLLRPLGLAARRLVNVR